MEIAAFEKLVGEAYALDAEIVEIKRQTLEPKQKRLDEVEALILQTLADNDLKSFKSSHGLVVRSLRYSIKTPKSNEEKVAFFEWLNKEKGREVYWAMATVNSQTLNAFYKAEMEAAKEAGTFDFSIPGLGAPEAQPILSRRKK